MVPFPSVAQKRNGGPTPNHTLTAEFGTLRHTHMHTHISAQVYDAFPPHQLWPRPLCLSSHRATFLNRLPPRPLRSPRFPHRRYLASSVTVFVCPSPSPRPPAPATHTHTHLHLSRYGLLFFCQCERSIFFFFSSRKTA